MPNRSPRHALLHARVRIAAVSPRVDCMRYPVKRTVGDAVEAAAPGGARSGRVPRCVRGAGAARRGPPESADPGFGVVYLPPSRPIGTTNRKGRNNVLAVGRDDPGSPWAIGGPEGGHEAVHPELGTL